MDELDFIKNWLVSCPHWDGDAPQVDKTDAQLDSCGLFPLGLEVLSRRENLLGQVQCRCRLSFALRKNCAVGQSAAQWLLDVQNWVLENSANAPKFGIDQNVRAEKGALTKLTATGTGLYEARIAFEFTKAVST